MILRDYWFCWVNYNFRYPCKIFFRLTRSAKILSIAFELAEYSLQHQLPNFEEVWFSLHSVVMTQLSPGF
jgi:phosphatidylserine synthase 2